MNKHTKTKRIIFIFILSFVVSIQSVLADSKKTQNEQLLEKVRLQLKWVHEFNFAGYVAAVEKGFYREAGLDVELIEGKPGVNFFEEVLSGRAEYGVEISEILLERNKGKPLVVLAAIFQHSPQIFLMTADSEINSPQDLIGHRVMWRFDSAAELGATLKNEGVDYEDIEFVELSWDINDLIDKKVDAIHAYITAQPFVMEQRGIAYTLIRPITVLFILR
jgi:ABC-type nitrate/sulfonate/bicarbonate transport system substrate-binding protein